MTTAVSHSLWSPLRIRAFRGLWGSSAVYFIGNAMQAMAASWLMVELTGSSFLAALVQTERSQVALVVRPLWAVMVAADGSAAAAAVLALRQLQADLVEEEQVAPRAR